jgi:hypothetical protein
MAVQAVPSSVAQRIIFKFFTKEGVIPSEIFTRLQAQFGDECLSQPRVFSWAKSFLEGRDRVENEPHARRPRTFVNPENVLKIGEKRASKQYKHTHSPTPKRSEINCFSGEDHGYCVLGFQGNHSRGLSHCLKTINAQYYSTLLNKRVKPAIRSKRRRRQNSVFFLQDNVRPHTAALMMATPLKLKWDVLPHPPYSPDLAPSDYHLFGPMKGV